MSTQIADTTALESRRAELEAHLGDPVTFGPLTRDFNLFSRKRGYRYSTDDLLTAWYAITHRPARVERMLDLGIGIGCVGLACAWAFPEATLLGIEAQPVSACLLEANIWANGLESRVAFIESDLRAISSGELQVGAPFDLVTASPPYFPPGSGLLPNDAQLAHCRFELNGDISDYCHAAAKVLAPEGRFVFCFPSVQMPRAEAAITAGGLQLHRRCDVVPKDGQPALFSLFTCTRQGPVGAIVEPPMVVRSADGQRTAQMEKARAVLGMASP